MTDNTFFNPQIQNVESRNKRSRHEVFTRHCVLIMYLTTIMLLCVRECNAPLDRTPNRHMICLMTHTQYSYHNVWKWTGMLYGVLLRYLEMCSAAVCVCLWGSAWRKFSLGVHDVLVRNLIRAIDCKPFDLKKVPGMLQGKSKPFKELTRLSFCLRAWPLHKEMWGPNALTDLTKANPPGSLVCNKAGILSCARCQAPYTSKHLSNTALRRALSAPSALLD